MKLKNFVVLAFVFSAFFSNLTAETAYFRNDDFAILVKYNNEVIPGNAVFARLIFNQNKTSKKNIHIEKASLQIFQDGKLSASSPFYTLNKNKKQTYIEQLSGVPVSIWLEQEATFNVKIVFETSDNQNNEFELPVVYKLKNFINEEIELDEKNTDIRTDYSPERMAQIEKLNNIFFTTLTQDVFQLKPFAAPLESTRYTAYCGDRRTFIYSNGKKSKTLHFGNDYGVPTGTEVHSCADGKVVLAEDRISTGFSIVIEHLPGLYSVYYHLSELNVKEGEMVKINQLIGKSGATGMVTGPHLHWEMRLNGSAITPEFFLNDFTFEENK